LALGTASLSPLEVARAFSTIAAGGVRPWPHAFEDVVAPEEGTLERRELRFERVVDAGTAFLTTSLLAGVIERGTGRRVRAMGMTGSIAGKTGTTDDEYDLWFAGFTPDLVAIVWVGFDSPRSIGVSSSRAAIPIWVRFMRDAVGANVRGSFPKPSGIETLAIDPESGALALSGCPRKQREHFLVGTEPDLVCTWTGTSRRDPRDFDRARGGRRRGILDWLRGR
jgi:membrane carboxypeptidase/penicillin-binding protein